MAPPKKEVKIEMESKVLLQSYLESLANQEVDEDGTATVITVNGEEEPDANVTYFVDEEGRYYYQSAGDSNQIVSLPTAVSEEAEDEVMEEVNPLMEGTEGYQTVTLVPSEAANGEVSYVLVVQDDKELMKVNKTEEKDDDDVYNFEDEAEAIEDESEEEAEEAGKASAKKRKSNKKKTGRPHFTCTFCAYTSTRRYLLLRHMKSHSEDRPHKCCVCERGFKTMASLQNHVNMHNGVKPHICRYCKSPFTTSGELVRHVRYKHTHEKPHKCSECDYASVELSKLRRHVRCHTGERPYQCMHCTYASPDTFKLKRHMRTHTGEKPYKCEHCSMCFTQSNSLKAHKMIHNISAKPVYACELCPTKCGRKTDLRIHVQKLHTSEMPLECKRCGKKFPDRYSCKIHNKSHEGEKCFKCDHCPYASTTARHLKSHMLKHTDEKPFACSQCDQSFRQKQLLRRHQNLYHNPEYKPKPPKEKTHSCRECRRQFAHKGNLIRHLAVHDPDSGHRERALALKLGRQKKIKYVDGPILQKSSYTESESSETEGGGGNGGGKSAATLKLRVGDASLKRGELVTVADGEGLQYVVLEVIQLEDGSEQHVAVVAPDADAHRLRMEPEGEEEDEEEEEEEEEGEEPSLQEAGPTRLTDRSVRGGARLRTRPAVKLEKDVDECFGFDEEAEVELGQESMVLSLV